MGTQDGAMAKLVEPRRLYWPCSSSHRIGRSFGFSLPWFVSSFVCLWREYHLQELLAHVVPGNLLPG